MFGKTKTPMRGGNWDRTPRKTVFRCCLYIKRGTGKNAHLRAKQTPFHRKWPTMKWTQKKKAFYLVHRWSQRSSCLPPRNFSGKHIYIGDCLRAGTGRGSPKENRDWHVWCVAVNNKKCWPLRVVADGASINPHFSLVQSSQLQSWISLLGRLVLFTWGMISFEAQ